MEQRVSALEARLAAVTDLRERVDLLFNLAFELSHMDPPRSRALCEEARQLAARWNLPDASGLAASRLIFSIIEWDVSNYQAALPLALEALSLFQASGDIARQAYTLNHIASIHFFLGNYPQAFELGSQALAICESTNDRGLQASILNDTAYICLHLQKFPDALPKLFKSLTIHRELGSKSGEIYTLDSISKAYYLMGDHAQALSFGLQSLACARAIALRRSEAETLDNLGKIYAASGNDVQALFYFEQALTLCRSHSYKQFEASTLLDIGKLYTRRQAINRALEYLAAAQKIALEIGAKQTVYETYEALAAAYKQQGDFQKALACYEQFHAGKEEIFNERSDDRIRSLQVVHDVETAKKEAEIYQLRNVALQQEIREREKLIAELNAFADTVAHDIKSPIVTMVAVGELLLDKLSTLNSPEITALAERLLRMGYKTCTIVDDLLMLASVRGQEITLRRLDMAVVVSEVETRLASIIASSHTELIKPVKFPPALGYAPWVEEVWANYIGNAIKYGGKPPRVELGATPEDGMIRFWVRDNGVGLAPEAQTQLFTQFTRVGPRDVEGHGLGLSIVKRIVEKLGGTVRVESAGLNQGSTFSFTLPAA
jgi:signal transduction histidine kinase